MPELEDIVTRRDYKLKIRWKCLECLPENQNKDVKIYMTSLKGEPAHEKGYPVTETDLVHQLCQFGHITKPKRFCSRCSLEYNFEDDICVSCESRIKTILTYEESIEDTKEQIRLKKRKKEDFSQLQKNLELFQKELDLLLKK